MTKRLTVMGEPATVYRVQDAKGRGPFRPGFSEKWVEERPDHDNLQPWLIEFPDVLKSIRTRQQFSHCSYGCGCKSLDQLRRWFTRSEYSRLKEFGYSAVVLQVDRILAQSEVQCVFERELPLTWGAKAVELWPRRRRARR